MSMCIKTGIVASAANVSTLTLDSNNTQAIMDFLGLTLNNPPPEFYNELGILGLYQLKDLQFISPDNPSLTQYLNVTQQNSFKDLINYITLCNTNTTAKFNPTLSSQEMKKTLVSEVSTSTAVISNEKSNKVTTDDSTSTSNQTDTSNFSGIISDIKRQMLEMVKPFTP